MSQVQNQVQSNPQLASLLGGMGGGGLPGLNQMLGGMGLGGECSCGASSLWQSPLEEADCFLLSALYMMGPGWHHAKGWFLWAMSSEHQAKAG